MEMSISQIEALHRSLLPQQLQSTRRITQQEELHRRCRFLPTNCSSSSSSSAHRLPKLQHRVVPSEPVVERLHPLHDVVDSCEDGLVSDELLAETINRFPKSIPSYILTADREGFFANVTVDYERFHDMGLQYNLLKGICDYGLVEPNDVQQMGIVPFCEGRDVILLARSGRGKTTTLCCGILQQLDYGNAECQALILVPTTELAEQIEKVMQALGYFLGVNVHACVGGTSVREDQRILSSGVHVVVGTPGHVFDMLRGQSLRPDYIKTFALDEACEMFSQGFEDQIYNIFELLPSKVQVGVSSATMHPEALDITRKFMNNPMKIELIESDEPNLADIKQFYVNVEKEEMKFEALCDLYKMPATTQSVIFVNTNRKVDWLADKMCGCGHAVSAVHQDMDESSGYTNMDKFVNGSSRVLITTDQLALSVDVLQVPVIVNYDLPFQHEDYPRRIAGIGRDGGEGIAINFVTEDDKNMLSDIRKLYNVVVKELPSNPSIVDLLLISSSGCFH